MTLLLTSPQLRKVESRLISLMDRTFSKATKVRSLDYAKELPRNAKRWFGSATFSKQLDLLITEIIKQSILYTDGQMKVLSAAAVAESHILTDEAVRISGDLSAEVAESIVRMLKDDAIYYQHPTALARKIQDQWGKEKYKAVRFARTFTADVATATTVHRYRQYGVRYMEFDAEIDDRTSDQCRCLEGTIFDLSKDSVDLYRPPLHFHCRSGLKPVPITQEIDENRIFENRDFSGSLEDPAKIDKAFQNIYKFNDKYRISKYVLDQDLAARIMFEKGAWVGVNGPSLDGMLQILGKDAIEEVPVLENTIRTHEAEIRDMPQEHCFAFSSDGVIVLQKSGTVNQINISPSDVPLLKGTIFTHNHPSGSSFSTADIRTACKVGLKEIRATGEYRTYIMRMVDGGTFREDVWAKISPVYDLKNEVVKNEFWAKIGRGELTPEEASIRHAHEVWSRTAKEISSIEYTYIEEI